MTCLQGLGAEGQKIKKESKYGNLIKIVTNIQKQ